MNILILFGKFILLIAFATAAVPHHTQKQGLDAKWQRMQNYSKEVPEPITAENINIKDRIERLGYTTGYGGSGINTYGGTGVGSYNSPKIDLAGVVIGSIIGLGAFLLIPKILNIFNTGYYGGQGYGRSEGDDTFDSNTFSNAMTKLDDILAKHNIDSTSCVQRAVCTYVRSTETNLLQGNQDQIDKFVHGIARNDIVEYMLDGTAIKEALENGKRINAVDCAETYKACTMDSNTIGKILSTAFKTMTT